MLQLQEDYMCSLLTGIKFGGEQLGKFHELSMFWNMNSFIFLSVAGNCGYAKQWFVGKVPRN